MEKELLKKFIDRTVSVRDSVPATVYGEVSRIAQGARIVGEISSKTDIIVDGNVEGKLYSHGRVIVGPTALLKGSLVCTDVDFRGRMDGDVYVKGILSLKSNAVINGNIHVCKLEVEMGGQLNGSCKMISDEEFDKLKQSVVTMEAPEPVVVKKGGNSMKLPSAASAMAANAAVIEATDAANKASMKSAAATPLSAIKQALKAEKE